jgi:hypothetical protein
MGFASGAVSFRRYLVTGKSPKSVTEELLEKLSEHALRPSELGMPEEVEYGWSGGRHVLDGDFSFENNVYADALHFGLRVDTNKVPGDLKKAYLLMEEEAAAASNPSGFISKNQKRDARETVRRKVEEETRSGKFRRSKLTPILWDLSGHMIYSPASGAVFEKLSELFERTFGLELTPLTSGSLAHRLLEPRGRRRDYEDLRPTRFAAGPGGEGEHPEYPWVAKGPEPKDFLGNEFLVWLWHEADAKTSIVATEESGDVTIFIDKSLDLDCAYGQSGSDSLRSQGPSRMPEARAALRSGKVPRRAGLILDVARQQYTLSLKAESMAVGTAKLPEVEADTPRVLFEERVALLRELGKITDGLFDTFLKIRASSAWEGHVNTIRRWITTTTKNVAAA